MHPRGTATCLNCGAAETGEYCARCGQKNTDLRAPVRALASEVVEEALGVDSRLRHTLLPFFTRPGFLTAQYNEGRRVRFTSPLKLYLYASVLFFLALTWYGGHHKVVELRLGSDPQELQAKIEQKNPLVRWLAGRIVALEKEGPGAAQRRVQVAFLDTLPKAPIVLVPIFALLLRLFWRRAFYVEHLVFALHFHAFAFLAVALGVLADSALPEPAATLAVAFSLLLSTAYLFGALRRVYGDGKLRTVLKMFALGALYLLAFAGALFGVVIVSLALA